MIDTFVEFDKTFKIEGVVVTLSFNAKMVLANFECNLND